MAGCRQLDNINAEAQDSTGAEQAPTTGNKVPAGA